MIEKPLNKQIDVAADVLEKTKDAVVYAHETQPARTWVGLAALAGAVLASLLAVFLLRDFDKRNIEYMPDMAYSKAWEAQTTHDYAQDYARYTEVLPPWMEEHGAPDMPPPEGTRYRGQRTLGIPAGEEQLQGDEARNLRNPYAGATGEDRARLLKRGSNLFVHTCQACHGVDGVGDAPVTKYGIGAPAIDTPVVRDRWTDGQIFHIITHGRATMPAHATHVDYDDRWKVILYLRSLQEGK